ncbi:MAG: glycosyltransferase family 4 protein [Thermoplasmatales archaeon]|nr:glycosyltransferase family 4 protein [Thermoplasmatales archaeon]
MKKINVLQVVNVLGLGSDAKNVGRTVKHFDKNIFNVSVCVLVPGGLREREIRKMGIKLYNVNRNPEKFAELIKKKKIHVVHFSLGERQFSIFAKAAIKAGALAIILLDSMEKMVDPEISKLFDRHSVSKMCAFRYKKWYKISNEEFHKNHMVAYLPIDVDEIDDFRISKNEILRRREKLGIGPNDLVIGRIGRPDIGKWSNILIDMMPHLIKKVPNVKFLIMGAPEVKKEEIEKSRLNKHFIFLKTDPSDRSVIEFLCLIDIFAYSSIGGESFGRSIAEAMACKKPVVVNSTPLVDNAQVELVDNGKTGFVVYSPNAFAEAIAYLASNRDMARKMGLAGYAKVKREYEAKKYTRMLEKRILELLRAKGVEVPKKILKRYEKIHYFPSREEIDNFEFEYERRLKDCFGKPDFIKILIGKYIAFSFLMQKFIRSSKLTAIRNIIRSSGAR